MNVLNNGPFIYAVGGVGRPDFTVRSARLPEGLTKPRILFSDDGAFSIDEPLSPDAMSQPLPQPVLKASGVARARNAAKSTVFAALLAHDFIKYINDLPGFNPDRVAIGVCNCSASAAISWQYETEGVTMGWDKTNTMLMPSSLPSAIGTQISAAVKTHAATITFLNDALGMCSAFEYALLSFFHQRADYALIIGAEEFSTPHRNVMAHLGSMPAVSLDGAAGVLLSREKLPGVVWRLGLCSHDASGNGAQLPQDWAAAKKLVLDIDSSESSFTTLLLPYALNHLLASGGGGDGKAVLSVSISDRSRFILGFTQET